MLEVEYEASMSVFIKSISSMTVENLKSPVKKMLKLIICRLLDKCLIGVNS